MNRLFNFLLFLFLAFVFTHSNASVFPVTSNGAGVTAGTLEYAVYQANQQVGLDTIIFQINTGPQTINLNTTLIITDPVMVDGTTQPGYPGTFEPIIQITGTALPASNNGIIELAGASNGSLIKGLSFLNASRYGLYIFTNQNIVENCWFGLNADGISATANNLTAGVRVDGKDNNIGGVGAAKRNVFGGCTKGVFLVGGNNNLIVNGFFGLDKTGMGLLPLETGVQMDGSSFNLVGGQANYSNYFANCSNNAIFVGSGSDNNIIQCNYFGVLADFSTVAGINNNFGIRILQSKGTQIGGIYFNQPGGRGNVFCNTTNAAICLQASADSTVISGNLIGITPLGVNAGNYCGIEGNSASNCSIGGNATDLRNTISNSTMGIYLAYSPGFKIAGNLLGYNLNGTDVALTTGNEAEGIRLLSSENTVIGGNTTAERNYIANFNNGIVLYNGSNNCTVNGNYIGVTPNGLGPIGISPTALNANNSNGLLFTRNVCGQIQLNACKNALVTGNKVGVKADGSGAISIPQAFAVSAGSEGTVIGGPNPQDRNVFSGDLGNPNSYNHIFSDSVTFQNNCLGVDSLGNNLFPSQASLLVNGGKHVLIGGINANEGNIFGSNKPILFTNGAKVQYLGNINKGIVYSGIDIENNGVDNNDTTDVDNGMANNGQNYPVINCVTQRSDNTGYDIAVSLNSEPNKSYVVEFFSNDSLAGGWGNGQQFLGRITLNTNALGDANGVFFTHQTIVNAWITATATDLTSYVTSEFALQRGVSKRVVSVTQNKCATAPNGSISVLVVQGNAPYTYLWSGGESTSSISNLPGGTYSVETKTGTGCVFYDTIQINSPTPISFAHNAINSYCGNANGSVNIMVSGGIPPYSYAWSNGSQTQNISGLFAGSYSVQVSDSAGCMYTSSAAYVADNPAIPPTITASAATVCIGDSVTLSCAAAGITAYNWFNASTASSLQFAPVASGYFKLTGTDVNGCISSDSVYLTVLSLPTGNFNVTAPSCLGTDGSINISLASGNGTITYTDTNNIQLVNWNNFAPGTYIIHLTDSSGCKSTEVVTIPASVSSTNVVSGTVNVNSGLLTDYKVIVYKKRTGTAYEVIAEQTINGGSTYSFSSLPADTVVIGVFGTIGNTPVGVFYGDTEDWMLATDLILDCGGVFNADITITVPLLTNSGLGSNHISGRVLDVTNWGPRRPGEPLRGVDITVDGNPGGAVYRTQTDGNGNYSFSGIPGGNYVLSVNVPGCGVVRTYDFALDNTVNYFDEKNFFVDSIGGTIDTTTGVDYQSCTFMINAASTPVCVGSASLLSDLTLYGDTTLIGYQWDFTNDGVVDDTTKGSVSYLYPAKGLYTAKLRIFAYNGLCENTLLLNVVVDSSTYLVVNQNGCLGDSVYAGGAYQYQSGIYTDSLHTATGCDSVITTYVRISQLPRVTLDLSSDTTCNQGGYMITLTESPVGGVFSGTPANSGVFDPTGLNGNFDFIYAYTDSNGCSASDTATLFVDVCSGMELSEREVFTLWPNPSYTTLHLKGWLNNEKYLLEIHDITGKKILNVTAFPRNSMLDIDVAGLVPGLYTIELTNGIERRLFRFAKE